MWADVVKFSSLKKYGNATAYRISLSPKNKQKWKTFFKCIKTGVCLCECVCVYTT